MSTNQPAGEPRPLAQDPKFQNELKATLGARHELGAAYEPELIDAFLGRLDQAIDARIEQRLGQRNLAPRVRPDSARILAISLGLAIPLVAIAGGIAGGFGILAVLLLIGALVVYFDRSRN